MESISRRIYKVRRTALPATAERSDDPSTQHVKVPWRNNIVLMAVAAAVLVANLIFVYQHCFNFDIWYMLATGREIISNGIPYENPFSQQEGMQIIVQQWMLCVLSYWIYTASGFAGLAWWTVLLTIGLVLSLYKLGRLKKRDGFGAEILLVLAIPALFTLDSYITMCSSIYSMIAYCWIVFLCEKYRQTGAYLWLALLFPLALIHVGFHMSLAIFDLVIIACYLIPDLLKPLHRNGHARFVAFADSSYKRLPLLIAFIGVAVALCINPYGIRGALYLFLSYGAADYGGAIPEMAPLAPAKFPFYSYAVLLLLIAALFVMGSRGLRCIDLPLTLLVFGTSFMMFEHARNLWLPAIFAYALVAGGVTGWSWDFARFEWVRSLRGQAKRIWDVANRIVAGIILVASIAFASFQIITIYAPTVAQAEKLDDYSPTGIMTQIVREAGNTDVTIFNPIRLGGFIEWVGYKPYIDTRLEIWNSPISGVDRNYYNEYVDMMEGEWSDEQYDEFFGNNDFDYIITERKKDMDKYMPSNDKYENVMGTDKFSLWRKVK